ncbi:MAG: hypothetical protein NC925_02745, partial [Candidatus Omnitrophica bacterium]|nr:hypothetical protein [Candidatus Omnitrophota bacterium]
PKKKYRSEIGDNFAIKITFGSGGRLYIGIKVRKVDNTQAFVTHLLIGSYGLNSSSHKQKFYNEDFEKIGFDLDKLKFYEGKEAEELYEKLLGYNPLYQDNFFSREQMIRWLLTYENYFQTLFNRLIKAERIDGITSILSEFIIFKDFKPPLLIPFKFLLEALTEAKEISFKEKLANQDILDKAVSILLVNRESLLSSDDLETIRRILSSLIIAEGYIRDLIEKDFSNDMPSTQALSAFYKIFDFIGNKPILRFIENKFKVWADRTWDKDLIEMARKDIFVDMTTSSSLPQDASSRGLDRETVNSEVKKFGGIDSFEVIREPFKLDLIKQAMALLGNPVDIRKQLEQKGVRFVRAPPAWSLGAINYVEDGITYIILPSDATKEDLAHEIWAVLNPDKDHNQNPIKLNNTIDSASSTTPEITQELQKKFKDYLKTLEERRLLGTLLRNEDYLIKGALELAKLYLEEKGLKEYLSKLQELEIRIGYLNDWERPENLYMLTTVYKNYIIFDEYYFRVLQNLSPSQRYMKITAKILHEVGASLGKQEEENKKIEEDFFRTFFKWVGSGKVKILSREEKNGIEKLPSGINLFKEDYLFGVSIRSSPLKTLDKILDELESLMINIGDRQIKLMQLISDYKMPLHIYLPPNYTEEELNSLINFAKNYPNIPIVLTYFAGQYTINKELQQEVERFLGKRIEDLSQDLILTPEQKQRLIALGIDVEKMKRILEVYYTATENNSQVTDKDGLLAGLHCWFNFNEKNKAFVIRQARNLAARLEKENLRRQIRVSLGNEINYFNLVGSKPRIESGYPYIGTNDLSVFYGFLNEIAGIFKEKSISVGICLGGFSGEETIEKEVLLKILPGNFNFIGANLYPHWAISGKITDWLPGLEAIKEELNKFLDIERKTKLPVYILEMGASSYKVDKVGVGEEGQALVAQLYIEALKDDIKNGRVKGLFWYGLWQQIQGEAGADEPFLTLLEPYSDRGSARPKKAFFTLLSGYEKLLELLNENKDFTFNLPTLVIFQEAPKSFGIYIDDIKQAHIPQLKGAIAVVVIFDKELPLVEEMVAERIKSIFGEVTLYFLPQAGMGQKMMIKILSKEKAPIEVEGNMYVIFNNLLKSISQQPVFKMDLSKLQQASGLEEIRSLVKHAPITSRVKPSLERRLENLEALYNYYTGTYIECAFYIAGGELIGLILRNQKEGRLIVFMPGGYGEAGEGQEIGYFALSFNGNWVSYNIEGNIYQAPLNYLVLQLYNLNIEALKINPLPYRVWETEVKLPVKLSEEISGKIYDENTPVKLVLIQNTITGEITGKIFATKRPLNSQHRLYLLDERVQIARRAYFEGRRLPPEWVLGEYVLGEIYGNYFVLNTLNEFGQRPKYLFSFENNKLTVEQVGWIKDEIKDIKLVVSEQVSKNYRVKIVEEYKLNGVLKRIFILDSQGNEIGEIFPIDMDTTFNSNIAGEVAMNFYLILPIFSSEVENKDYSFDLCFSLYQVFQ